MILSLRNKYWENLSLFMVFYYIDFFLVYIFSVSPEIFFITNKLINLLWSCISKIKDVIQSRSFRKFFTINLLIKKPLMLFISLGERSGRKWVWFLKTQRWQLQWKQHKLVVDGVPSWVTRQGLFGHLGWESSVCGIVGVARCLASLTHIHSCQEPVPSSIMTNHETSRSAKCYRRRWQRPFWETLGRSWSESWGVWVLVEVFLCMRALHLNLWGQDTGVRSGASSVQEENPCHLIYFFMSFLEMALLCIF